MANANTTTTNRNIFTTIGRNTAAIVAAGALALGLSGCDNGNNPNESVKPLPTPSQIDKPTTPATQEPSAGNTEPGSGNPCVGQNFGFNLEGRKNAIDCLNGSGAKVDGAVSSFVDGDNDGEKDDLFIPTSKGDFVLLDTGVLLDYDK